jgi:hypothetical protein
MNNEQPMNSNISEIFSLIEELDSEALKELKKQLKNYKVVRKGRPTKYKTEEERHQALLEHKKTYRLKMKNKNITSSVCTDSSTCSEESILNI